MTLQELTNRLQDLCHSGHAQDEVVFEAGGSTVPFPAVEVDVGEGLYEGDVFFRIDAGAY